MRCYSTNIAHNCVARLLVTSAATGPTNNFLILGTSGHSRIISRRIGGDELITGQPHGRGGVGDGVGKVSKTSRKVGDLRGEVLQLRLRTAELALQALDYCPLGTDLRRLLGDFGFKRHILRSGGAAGADAALGDSFQRVGR